jgi:hypothetical protein
VPGPVARVRGARGRAAAAGQPRRVPAAGSPRCGWRRGRRGGPAAARGVPRRGHRAMRECEQNCAISARCFSLLEVAGGCFGAPLFFMTGLAWLCAGGCGDGRGVRAAGAGGGGRGKHLLEITRLDSCAHGGPRGSRSPCLDKIFGVSNVS